jgi:hypothetical protein
MKLSKQYRSSVKAALQHANDQKLELYKARKEFEFYLNRKGFTFEVCEGVWQGEREQSYMINLPATTSGFTELKDLAFERYNQDAVLRVTAYGGVKLIESNGDTEEIGIFTTVSEVPEDQCYTQSFKTGNIYITK